MKNIRLLVMVSSLAMLGLEAPVSAQFTENFDDGNASTRWAAPVVDAENGLFDGTVDFAFDYGALGIPAAPGGGSTTGLFFEANLTDQVGDEGESVAVSPLSAPMPNGDFKLTMDVYINVDRPSGGSTELSLFGIYATGANDPTDQLVTDDVPFDLNLSNGDGMAWHATGDGGLSADIQRYEDPGNLDAGAQFDVVKYDDIPDGTIPGVVTGNDNGVKFGPEESWVTITIESVSGLVSFQMNGIELDSVDNTGGTFTGGTMMVGYSDPFNSVADPASGTDAYTELTHFMVVDNVTLTGDGTGGVDGDFNDDSSFNCEDINSLSAEIAAGTNSASFDVTGDGLVNAADRDAWFVEAGAAELASQNAFLTGDLDLDGLVDSSDLGLLLNNFGATGSGSYCGGDLDADTNVDSSDLGLLLNNFGQSAAAIAAVPEPAALPLVLVALGGLGMVRRRESIA